MTNSTPPVLTSPSRVQPQSIIDATASRRQYLRKILVVVVLILVITVGLYWYVVQPDLWGKKSQPAMTASQTSSLSQATNVMAAESSTTMGELNQDSLAGSLYLKAGKPQQALDVLLKAQHIIDTNKLDGQPRSAYLLISKAYEQLGNKRDAKLYVQKQIDFIKRISPTDKDTVTSLEKQRDSL